MATIITTLHFLRNLQMGKISEHVTGKAWQGQTLYISGPIHKLQRK